MTVLPSAERLLSVIELQNAVAATAMSTDQIMAIVCDRARQLLAGTGSVVGVVDGNDIAVRATAGKPVDEAGKLARTSVFGRAVAEGKPVHDGGALAVPLLYGESAVGVLGVAGSASGSDDDIETLRLLAQVVAIALHRAYTYPKPKPDQLHDPLTGLGNKRAFDERVEAELARNKRYGHSFSLAFLDLDGLETAYDRLGQAVADEALRAVSSILSKDTRVIDGCFRTGPDDFAIVMPGTSLVGAKTLIDRCRTHIDEARLCDGMVTAAFGVVQAQDETSDELVTRVSAAHTTDKHARRS